MERTPENLARMPVTSNLRGMDTAENSLPTLASLNSGQKRLLAWTLAFGGITGLWRIAQTFWPSTGLAVAGTVTYAVAIVSLLHFLNSIPRYRPALPWCAGAAVGALLNFVVMAANGGYMPAVGLTEPQGLHAPMDGARLAILADWIMGAISPGDVLLIACGVAIVVVLVRQWRRRAA